MANTRDGFSVLDGSRKDGYGAPPMQPPRYDLNGNGYISGEYDLGDRNNKRMRVDEVGTNDYYLQSSRIMSDDERRLKLIRDHGAALNGPSHGGSNSLLGTSAGFNHQSSQPYMHSSKNGSQSSNFDQVGYTMHSSVQIGNSQDVASNNSKEGLLHNLDLESRYFTNSKMSERMMYVSEIPNESYDTHSPNQFQAKDAISSKRPRYSQSTNWQVSNAPHLEQSSVSMNNHVSLPYASQPSVQQKYDFHNLNQMYGHHDMDQPPLPSSPPPPPPVEPPGSSSSPLLFPVPERSSAAMSSLYHSGSISHSLGPPFYHNNPNLRASSGLNAEEPQPQATLLAASKHYMGQEQPFRLKHLPLDKPKMIDAFHIFKQPFRANRPDHIVIILRGLAGSGKSYLAKMLRDIEVENGGDAPRIHSMDDYFMTEVEKVDENEVPKSSTSIRGKKPNMKKVMEYCYEPEMEEAYRSSMLKAFKKTVEEGVFSFIIVDDRNLRVADFAQFWAIAKRSGYEVYLLEASYKDPAGCAARNVHGFSLEDIKKMASQWEDAPSMYLQLDAKSLFQGDDLKETGIQEIDMDMEDGDADEDASKPQERKYGKITESHAADYGVDDSLQNGKRWDVNVEQATEEVKQLGRSKWSNDNLDEDDTEGTRNAAGGKANSLSGLIQAYGKEGSQLWLLNRSSKKGKCDFFGYWAWARIQLEVKSIS